MPSRRSILSSVAAGVSFLGGCGERTRSTSTTPTKTTGRSERSPETDTVKQGTPTDDALTEAQCDEEWTPSKEWTGLQGNGATAANSASFFVYEGDQLSAYDVITLEKQWQMDLKDSNVIGSVSLLTAGENTLIAASGGICVAIDANSGDVLWSYTLPTGSPTTKITSLEIAGETLYIGAINRDTPSFDAETQSVRIYKTPLGKKDPEIVYTRKYEEQPPHVKDVLVSENQIIVALDSTLLAINADGSINWENSDIDANSVSLTDTVLLVTTDQMGIAVDFPSGTELWRDAALSGSITTEGGVGYGTTSNERYEEGEIIAFNPQKGEYHWRRETLGIYSTPVVHSDVVYTLVASSEGQSMIRGFKADSGCLLGSVRLSSDRGSSLYLPDTRLTTANDDDLWSFSLHS